MITPIFVVGMRRSGTTWLGNQLSEHPRIAGIRHVEHMGIHESAYFSHVYGRYEDLHILSNFIEFVEVISACDYFRLAGVTKDHLYSLWPTSYEEVFRTVMDSYAKANGADFWVEKSPGHTYKLDLLSKIYPEAKFIGITRNIESVVKSSLGMYLSRQPEYAARRSYRWSLILSLSRSWHKHDKSMRKHLNTNLNFKMIRYEDMKTDRARVMNDICKFLDIEFDQQMLTESFPPNTSFKGGFSRDCHLDEQEKRYIKYASFYHGFFPLRVFLLRNSIKEFILRRYRGTNKRDLPKWFFKLYQQELLPCKYDKVDQNG